MADKQTCHVTHAHWGSLGIPDPVFCAIAPVFPSPSSTQRRRRRAKTTTAKATRRVLFFSDLFLSASSSSLDALKRSISKVVHRDKNAIVSSFQHRAAQSRIRMHARCSKKGGAQTKTHRLETSLFGAVTRTDWAAAVWVKENIFVGVVLCVCT